MTSLTTRLQDRIDARPHRAPDPSASAPARRLLGIATVVSLALLVVSAAAIALDGQHIGGEPAWVKPSKFAVSIALALLTIRWVLGAVHAHRRTLTVLATVLVVALAVEVLWIDVQVVRGTTSHFNTGAPFDAAAYATGGFSVVAVFLATVVVAVLALRTTGLDAGVAAGIRWGLLLCVVGMLEAVSMIVNGTTSTTNGGHTVGALDGGPGLPLTGWSLHHGDLRVAHFVGLHMLQVLPVLAWFLLRRTRLDERVRRDLLRVAGVGAIALVALLWWQAERGQALLEPDAATIGAAVVLVVGTATGAAAVLVTRARRPAGR
ncbi:MULTISPECIES: hypothetical protein [unclassified Curtobacterium]|uniref:hypothetical protein n=1 Tax=unclassified Curtobacterium TaxID=257496 RepID=UPI0009F5FEA7|nr:MULTISPECIES: hypothetical protein [unclassified Curtobacterium]